MTAGKLPGKEAEFGKPPPNAWGGWAGSINCSLFVDLLKSKPNWVQWNPSNGCPGLPELVFQQSKVLSNDTKPGSQPCSSRPLPQTERGMAHGTAPLEGYTVPVSGRGELGKIWEHSEADREENRGQEEAGREGIWQMPDPIHRFSTVSHLLSVLRPTPAI